MLYSDKERGIQLILSFIYGADDAKNKEQTTEIHTTINQKEVQRIYLFLLTHITSRRVVMSCYFVFCLLLLLYIISTYHI